jgi:hypothetical protein
MNWSAIAFGTNVPQFALGVVGSFGQDGFARAAFG